jgi:hypothetical protein
VNIQKENQVEIQPTNRTRFLFIEDRGIPQSSANREILKLSIVVSIIMCLLEEDDDKFQIFFNLIEIVLNLFFRTKLILSSVGFRFFERVSHFVKEPWNGLLAWWNSFISELLMRSIRSLIMKKRLVSWEIIFQIYPEFFSNVMKMQLW